MNSQHITSVLTSAAARGSNLPPSAANDIRVRVTQRLGVLGKLLFGQFLTHAIVLAVTGAAFLVAGAVSSSAFVAVIGAVLVAAAGVCLLLNRPNRADETIAGAVQTVDQLVSDYTADFRRALNEFATSQRNRFAAAIHQSVAAGATLEEVRVETNRALASVNERLEALQAKRDAEQQGVDARASEFRRHREQGSGFCRSTRAHIMPWRVRRLTSSTLNALVKLGETRADLAVTDATIAIWAATAEALSDLAQAPKVTLLSPEANDSSPAWRGMPVPSRGEIEEAAISKARASLPEIRTRVLQAVANKESAEDAIQREASALFEGNVPWPESVGTYINGMNGAMPGLCESLINASAPLLASERTPGRKRNRRSFVIGKDMAHSPLIAELRKRLPDDENITTLEGPATELCLVTLEAGVPFAEIPEVQLALERYRAAPTADRDRITAAVPFEAVQNYHPERARTRDDSIRLACVALALQVLVRKGDQRYELGRKTIAKGFAALTDALAENANVADTVRASVDKAKTAAGIEHTVARLNEAINTPEKFVPTDAAETFENNLQAEIATLQHT